MSRNRIENRVKNRVYNRVWIFIAPLETRTRAVHRHKPVQNFVIRAGFFILFFEPGR